jgi:hypothetical protein
MAAYAVALQAILLAFGVPGAGAAGLATGAICASHASSVGGGSSAPAGHGQDCLDACLTGCCCGAPVLPAPGPAIAYAPALLQTIAVTFETRPILPHSAVQAHRSRAPPLA